MTRYEQITKYSLDQMSEFIFDTVTGIVLKGNVVPMDKEVGIKVCKQALLTEVNNDTCGEPEKT